MDIFPNVNNESYIRQSLPLSAMKRSFVVVGGKQPSEDHFPDMALEVNHLLEIWIHAH
jgi:hypothetical protein